MHGLCSTSAITSKSTKGIQYSTIQYRNVHSNSEVGQSITSKKKKININYIMHAGKKKKGEKNMIMIVRIRIMMTI